MRSNQHVLKEFREFVLRGNVIDLAVAVVIGAAFGAVISSFVANLLTPLIAAIGGKPDFSALSFSINGSNFGYGAFINAVISFLIISAVIFFLVVKPLNTLFARMKQSDEEQDAPTQDVALLEEIRDLLAAQANGDSGRRPTVTPPT